MRNEIECQKIFWNRNALILDSIYTGKKSVSGRVLDRLFRRDMYQRFSFTMNNILPVAGKSVLDVGCGTGLYSFEIAKNNPKEVYGIDVSDKMVELCRERAIERGFSSICKFTCGDPSKMKLGKKYDIAIAIGLFDYVTDALSLLKWIREQTNEKVILSFPRKYTWRAPIRRMRLFLKGCSVRFYSKREILSLLGTAGIVPAQFEKIGNLYCVVGSVRYNEYSTG